MTEQPLVDRKRSSKQKMHAELPAKTLVRSFSLP